MRNVSSKSSIENRSKHFSSVNFLPRKSCCLCGNVYQCGTAGQATDDDIRCTRIARWIPKAANTLSEYGNNGYSNASQCYVIRTWPILFLWRNPTHENVYRPEINSGKPFCRHRRRSAVTIRNEQTHPQHN